MCRTSIRALNRVLCVGETLRQVWVQTYTWTEGKVCWCSSEDIPPAARSIGSPYDVEAHSSKKRRTTWVG
ncbi:MAG TPA: hypothetical protein VGT82_06360 [Ktedonobacteraceae bacterium]|nr:hypothetical protein [Ktedonobacteraceae bacterium]